jgi:hypothetical protein
MTLIEAIKIGEKFYRRSWLDKTPIAFEDLYKLSKKAFVANDWEVEEAAAAVTITRSKLIDAYRNAHKKVEIQGGSRNICHLTALAERGAWIMKIGGAHFFTINFSDNHFNYLKIGISLPLFYKRFSTYDFFAEETKQIGIEMPTSIGMEKGEHFWSFNFLILGFGIELVRQKGY